MRRSIATVSLSGTLRAKLEAVAAARFDAVEIFENDLLFFDGSARSIRNLASDLPSSAASACSERLCVTNGERRTPKGEP
jgi:hypothetical protein